MAFKEVHHLRRRVHENWPSYVDYDEGLDDVDPEEEPVLDVSAFPELEDSPCLVSPDPELASFFEPPPCPSEPAFLGSLNLSE